MERLFLLISLGSLASYANAQTTEEWLRQKETALKYLTEQVLALKGHLDVVREGYGIIHKGVGLIQELKGADFRQHQTYFDALAHVSLGLHHYSNSSKCFAIYDKLEDMGRALVHQVGATSLLQKEEKTYLRQLIVGLSNNSKVVIEELKRILQHETYVMPDNERLARINSIYTDLRNKKVLLQSLTQQTGSLIEERRREERAIKGLKKMIANE